LSGKKSTGKVVVQQRLFNQARLPSTILRSSYLWRPSGFGRTYAPPKRQIRPN
jgi:hypothetical protein